MSGLNVLTDGRRGQDPDYRIRLADRNGDSLNQPSFSGGGRPGLGSELLAAYLAPPPEGWTDVFTSAIFSPKSDYESSTPAATMVWAEKA
jgi:hypothetical protein